jgi:hypothetical protein
MCASLSSVAVVAAVGLVVDLVIPKQSQQEAALVEVLL